MAEHESQASPRKDLKDIPPETENNGEINNHVAEKSAVASHPPAPAAAAQGPPQAGGPPGPKYQLGFFDPKFRPFRKVMLKILAPFFVLITFIMWTCLPMYWGSFWKAQEYTHNLSVMVINRDIPSSTSLGSAILNATNGNAAEKGVGHLGYFQGDASQYPDEASVEHAVVEEHVWAAVVINTDATSKLLTARQTGDATYEPTSAVSFYYNQGRMETAANYMVPINQAVLQAALAQWSAESTAQYLQSISGNTTAVGLLAQAPQTVSPGVFWTSFNLRVYSTPTAQALLLVGQIYMIIFTFIFANVWNVVRDIVAPKMKLRSYIIMRIVGPSLGYLWLSLMLSMVNLPFKMPFGAKFTYAGGYFLDWFITWLGMMSCGFALEMVITLLTQKFAAFCLLPIIIVQVSAVSLPPQLQPRLFHYGIGTPINRVNNALRTIIFNTKNTLGLDIGIIASWVILNSLTMVLVTIWRRKQMIKEDLKAAGGASPSKA